MNTDGFALALLGFMFFGSAPTVFLIVYVFDLWVP
jgi:hypothetical protein